MNLMNILEGLRFSKLTFDYVQLLMEITGVVVLSIFGFYAVGLLTTFRQGMLEKGWRNVTQGAIILVLAQIPILISPIGPTGLASLLDDTGAILRFIGIVLLILGFRAQYRVWRPNRKDLSPTIELNNQTS
jgi:hypothetical protein